MTAMLPVTYRLPNWPTGDEPTNLSSVKPVEGKDDFNVVIIGAGNINFGSDEGPWNHSYRLEHKLGPRMKVVSIIDPLVNRSEAVKQKKCDSFVQSAYKDTRCCRDLEEFSELVKSDKSKHPHLLVVGTPPAFRGSNEPGRDLELKLLKLFPNVPIFVDKPVSAGDVGRAFVVAKAIAQSGSPCSVGYMLRYLKAVQAMKKIIQDNQLTVMATIARYACAYESIRKDFWWDKTQSGGPIIEQGTHFCDLSRYFGGDVDIPTVQATTLEWDEEPGKLSKIGVDESKVSPENRIPRVTTANWKYKNGAVGIMTHLAALQGTAYACELEVYCDGYLMKLIDPYNTPILRVRRPGSDAEEEYVFKDDDPFFSEFSTFIDHIEKAPKELEVLSSFEDGCKTYELTWAIRSAAEANVTNRKK